jgi:hypothetical protein
MVDNQLAASGQEGPILWYDEPIVVQRDRARKMLIVCNSLVVKVGVAVWKMADGTV